MRKNMDASIRFQAPKAIKEKFWRLCYANGFLPSQALREAMIVMIDRLERLERERNENTNSKTKAADQRR